VGDYGSGPHEIRCARYDKNPETFATISGITTDPEKDEDFPYAEAPGCYEVEFWQTDFTNNLDGTQENLDVAYDRFRAFMDLGHPL
jgi:hypothetical protein